MVLRLIFTVLISLCVTGGIFGQGISVCKEFVVGKIIDLPKPDFPQAAKSAKVAGKVEVRVKINEKGYVTFAEIVSGNPLLLESAITAAKKAKYSPQLCDNKPLITDGIITYNFILPIQEKYFLTDKVEDFADISRDSEHYESILFLTENAKISFGTADKRFEAERNLTRGEFIEFLFKTITFLDERASLLGTDVKKLKIYKTFNTNQLKSISDIKDFDEFRPYSNSLQKLIEKYDIAIVNKTNYFNGSFPMSSSEIVDYWRKIFGEEVIPINFKSDKATTINRGEFAIFLTESLEILTYKLLPE
jgi:TonB family protein